MDNYINDLLGTALFAGIAAEQIKGLLNCVGARIVRYQRDELIVEENATVATFGVMLSGRARAFKLDAAGRVITLTLLEKGSEIGVILAAGDNHRSPVAVEAQTDSTVLLIPYEGLIGRCERNCPRHERLLRNYIGCVAQKGLVLHERIDCLLKPTVREKIMAYLTRMSREQGDRSFTIPLDRYGLSEYLNIERSALSRELSRMKKEGLIDFQKNYFRLL